MEQHELVKTEPIEQLVNKIGADQVFGAPTTENGVVIIPVAQAAFGFGYGGGYGIGLSDSDNANEQSTDKNDGIENDSSEGGGGGSGGGGHVTPRGYIRISAGEVKYEPIVDEIRIPLAAIALAAWSIFWITATVRVIARSVAKTKQIQAKGR